MGIFDSVRALGKHFVLVLSLCDSEGRESFVTKTEKTLWEGSVCKADHVVVACMTSKTRFHALPHRAYSISCTEPSQRKQKKQYRNGKWLYVIT